MINKKEEYSFSLNPEDDNSLSVYLRGADEEEAEKAPLERPKPRILYEKNERPREISKSVPKSSFRKEVKETEKVEKPAEKVIIHEKKENGAKSPPKRGASSWRKIRVLFTLFLLTGGLIFLFVYANPSLTLNVGSGKPAALVTFAEKLDYETSGNSSFILDLDYSKFGRQGEDASIGITGLVAGSGRVKVYLVDENDKKAKEYVVYDNQVEKSEKLFTMSGVIGTGGMSNEKTDEETGDTSEISKFEYACVDTCYSKFKEGMYTVRVETDNAAIRIDNIILGF